MFTMLWRMQVVKTDGSTRRDRLHAQTRDEILAAGRVLVARGEEVSLRAVARAVGMTAPALYRYVDSHGDLLDLIGGDLYDELIDDLERARDAIDETDLQGRLVAMAHAFRRWALAHRHEYALLYANPLDSQTPQATEGGCTLEASKRFGALFAEVFLAMWQAGLIDPPDIDRLDPALLRMLQASAHGTIELPLEVHYLFVRQWSRLYGMVTLEAFGHLHWALEDSLPLFEVMLDECAAELGFADQRRAQRDVQRPKRGGRGQTRGRARGQAQRPAQGQAQRSNSRPKRRDATASPTDPMISK